MFENGAGRAPSSYAPEHTHIPVYIRCKPAVYDGSGQSSLFVGKIEFFHELNAPEGWLYLDGSVLNNASTTYPRLWEHLKNSPWKCCTEEQWQQMSTDAGGIGGVWRYVMNEAQNTLRLMDVRGDSVRFAGGKKDDTTYWQVGDWHPDATQHITGEFAMWTGSYAPFVASQYDANPTAHATGPFTKGTRVSNGVNPAGQSGGYKVAWDNSLAARTADEERVRAGNLLPCVYTGNGSRGDVWGTGEGGGGGGGDGDVSVSVTHERTYLVGDNTSDKNNNFYPVNVAASTFTELKLFEKFAATDSTDWLPNDDGKLVAPRNGVIMCAANVRMNVVNGLYHANTQINVNGQAYRTQEATVNTITACESTVYAQVPVKAGDIISVSIELNVATAVTQCTLSAFYIDPKVEASGGGSGGSGGGESGGGTGNVSLHTVRTENDYDAANGDFVIAAAPVIITLTNLKDAKVDVKRMTKDGAITVRAESGSIDEYAEVYLYTNKETASFICDGENWYRA